MTIPAYIRYICLHSLQFNSFLLNSIFAACITPGNSSAVPDGRDPTSLHLHAAQRALQDSWVQSHGYQGNIGRHLSSSKHVIARM
jgi:hypothetical protein